MAGEWRELTLDQLGRIVTGKTPSSKGQGYFGGTIPFVTPTDFDGRRIISDTGRYLTEKGAASVAGARIPSRAVMVTCIGSDMGKAAIAGHNCVTNQQINSILVGDDNEPLFVYYNLSWRKAEIRSRASGSAQPILNKSGFGAIEIALPPLPEQRAIAHILGTLDDKIEVNRRMSETLEAMARALFKSWFVDFDPVRAKCRGGVTPPLHWPQHILDFFPARFVDSELGEIPEGWEGGNAWRSH
jgi:type I restriction enzyme S subunit